MASTNVVAGFVAPGSHEPLVRSGHELRSASGASFKCEGDGIPVFASVDSTEAIDSSEHASYTSYAERPELGPRRVVVDADFLRKLIALHTSGNLPPFGDPVWLDATYDVLAQEACYSYVGDLRGKRVAQLGGKGFHAAKAIVAGAAEVWHITPVLAEARYFLQMAEEAMVVNPACIVHIGVAVAEELPIDTNTLDVILSGGCLHHTVVPGALFEARRVLSPGGRFAAWDPWRAPLYSVGTKVFGKRERGVNCRPLDARRLKGSPPGTEVRLYSPVVRYLLLVLFKLRVPVSLRLSRALQLSEDRWVDRLRVPRRWGSSAAVLLLA